MWTQQRFSLSWAVATYMYAIFRFIIVFNEKLSDVCTPSKCHESCVNLGDVECPRWKRLNVTFTLEPLNRSHQSKKKKKKRHVSLNEHKLSFFSWRVTRGELSY